MNIKILILTFCIVFFAKNVVNAQTAGVPVSEYNSLVDFYNHLDGDNWNFNDNWLDTINHSVSDWFGVIVTEGHVNKIVMDSNNVVGTLPTELGNLEFLDGIYLTNNKISGNIPNNLGNLSNLEDLALNFNEIDGSIPTSLGNIASLRILHLGNNYLESSIPSSIENCTNLEAIFLGHNNISGTIPEGFGNLIKLRHLRLSNNSLTSLIPASLGNLTELRSLELNNNKFIGPIPIELKNLTKTYIINVDNNLIGEINLDAAPPFPKNAMAVSNRQIPDELADLVEMDTLYLGGNKLQFNDIEAIFSWDNYSDFQDFIYFPQDSIGISKTEEKFTGESITFSIDNYYPGPSDTHQWYKNGTLLTGKTNPTLELTNLQLSESGEYHCKVSNPVASALILNSRISTLNVKAIQGAGVPVSEFNALNEFYNALDGDNWEENTNWLDTLNNTVADWLGITITENSVTKIDLPANNLVGELPQAITNLTELTVLKLDTNFVSGSIENWIDDLDKLEELNLVKNNISGEINSELGKLFGLKSLKLSNNLLEGEIPGRLTNIKELHEFHIDSNRYTTVNIEPVFDWGNFDKFKAGFVYAPQYAIGDLDTITKNWGDTLIVQISNYNPGSADEFKWFKDSILLPSEMGAQISISQITDVDTGSYFCQITNTLTPDLTLSSKPILVKVNGAAVGAGIPVSEYLTLIEIYDTTMGLAWTNNQHWLDTTFYSVDDWYGITVENGHVSRFSMHDNNLTHIPALLNNLQELEVIDLSSGSFSGEIPNFEDLDNLKTLKVDDNNFTFKNLTPITSWANYNGFKSYFVYTPQPADIGVDTTISYQINDSIKLQIENYVSDDADNFEWFRNNISIQNSDEIQLLKKAWFDDNGATFKCEVTNSLLPDLTLISRNISTSVYYSSKDSMALANLKMEYDTLQTIWSGDSIFSWPLISAEKGIVTSIDLSGLNLSGNITPLFVDFDSLTWLNLSNNNLLGEVPGIASTKSGILKSLSDSELKIKYLNIANNNFIYADLEPAADELNSIAEFIYSPQANVGIPLDTTIFKYDTITFEIGNYIPGNFDVYTWNKNGNEITENNIPTFKIENAALQDSGFYTCLISNTLFPELTLVADTSWLKVLIPVGIDRFDLGEINIYPNPAQNKIYVDTKNEKVDIKIYNLYGKLLLDKNNFQSDWIDINGFSKGVYLFRVAKQNSEIINKKIIFN